MSWIVLIVSGMLEAVWAAALSASHGFTRLRPTQLFAAALVASMAGLAWAMTDLPTGTAYAVWVGIGASLTVGIDTADADRIRPFWTALTGHEPAKGDPDTLPSPDGQMPTIWFQTSEPRDDRGRLHIDVYVPHDEAQARVDAVVAAGGRLVTDEYAPSWWVLADADGNLACVCTWQESSTD